MSTHAPQLNDAQILFCHEYTIDYNGTRAYMVAYPGCSESSARSCANTLLTNTNTRAYINELKKQRIAETGIEARDIVERLYSTITADPNELIEIRRDCCRHCYGEGNRYQYTPGEWEAITLRHEQDKYRAEVARTSPPPDPDPRGGLGFNRRLPPNPGCPECFGEGVEDVFVKDTRYLSDTARELYAGVKITKGGIEIQKHSRDKAVELIGRHLAMFTDNLNHKNNGKAFEPMKLQDFYGGSSDTPDPEPGA